MRIIHSIALGALLAAAQTVAFAQSALPGTQGEITASDHLIGAGSRAPMKHEPIPANLVGEAPGYPFAKIGAGSGTPMIHTPTAARNIGESVGYPFEAR